MLEVDESPALVLADPFAVGHGDVTPPLPIPTEDHVRPFLATLVV